MFIQSRELLDAQQCGFKKGCSTVDHLVRLEDTIREAFIHKQYCLAVFFDLDKAYDTTWRFGILRDLADLGIRGRMLKCLTNFLSDRSSPSRSYFFKEFYARERGATGVHFKHNTFYCENELSEKNNSKVYYVLSLCRRPSNSLHLFQLVNMREANTAHVKQNSYLGGRKWVQILTTKNSCCPLFTEKRNTD